MSIYFISFNEPHLFLCMFVIACLNWMFKYYNVVTLEIRFSSSGFAAFNLKATVIHFYSDFTKLFFQRLYSFSCVVTKGFVSLACFQIFSNTKS